MSSISNTRRVLAVVAVTTALCADQAAVAASNARPQATEIGQIAARVVVRLAQNLRRAMPGVIHEPGRQAVFVEQSLPRTIVPASMLVAHVCVSPFQFRLPPPVC
jgi:ribosomal protein L14